MTKAVAKALRWLAAARTVALVLRTHNGPPSPTKAPTDEVAPVALPGRRGTKRSQHHGRRPEAAHFAARREQADQTARGRAGLSDLRARRPQSHPDHSRRTAGHRPRAADPAGSPKHP